MPHAPTATSDAQDRWAQADAELPPRPRRRLLRTDGGGALKLALLGVLLLACGFIGGVLVEKGQTASTTGSGASGGSGLAARLAALRGGASPRSPGASSASPAGEAAPGGGTSSGGGGFPSRFAGRFRGGGGGGAVIGEVSYIQGHTLYVSDAEGSTVKITTSPASSITKTVTTDVHGIHPGDTVVVRGPKGASGAVSAESVTVGTGGGGIGGGGIGSLFGGGPRSGG
jgi:hypothetical protein